MGGACCPIVIPHFIALIGRFVFYKRMGLQAPVRRC
jgi:hypothetical protein